MKPGIKALLLSLILILVMTAGSGCAANPQTPPIPADSTQPATAVAPPTEDKVLKAGPFKGMQALDFVLKDMSGTEWTLSELKGNSVALVFFTSW